MAIDSPSMRQYALLERINAAGGTVEFCAFATDFHMWTWLGLVKQGWIDISLQPTHHPNVELFVMCSTLTNKALSYIRDVQAIPY